MPKTKLTKQGIKKLPAPHPSGRQRLFWDTELKGFGLLVSGKTETKSYVVQRMVNGHSRRITLRTVVEAEAKDMSLEDIRKEAADLIHDMRQGKDPKAHRGPKANVTLREVMNDYGKVKEPIERHLKKWLDKPLREITPDAVEKRFKQIKEEVAARQKKRKRTSDAFSSDPGSASANGAMRALRAVWNYAANGRVPELPPNPVSIRLKRDAWNPILPRERHVSGDQLPAWYKAAHTYPSRTMRDYLLVLLFTGLRRDEAAGLRWADIDFAQRIILLPAKRVKAKRKLNLPMSDFVHDLLLARRELGIENAYVFPGDSKSGHVAEPKKALRKIGADSGVYVSPHDLRRTFITVASRCRIAPMELKALVNHALGGDVTEGYSQVSTHDLAEAMQVVTDRIKELCQIKPDTKPRRKPQARKRPSIGGKGRKKARTKSATT